MERCGSGHKKRRRLRRRPHLNIFVSAGVFSRLLLPESQ
nr:MAG TPA: hypothetical protein [Caudoviricetes sp.]